METGPAEARVLWQAIKESARIEAEQQKGAGETS